MSVEGKLNEEMFSLTPNPLRILHLCIPSVVRKIPKAKSCIC